MIGMVMKILRGILLVCITLFLAGCLSMNLYDGPKRGDAEVAEVYVHGTGGWPLVLYKINGQEHPFGFLFKEIAYLPPGKHAFRYRTEETDFEGEALTAFVTFNVDLKPGYSYFVSANYTDADTDTACIFEELRNDPAAVKGWLAKREPQDETMPLQCGSLDWKEWN
jgi:hypothetical protein